MSDLLNPTGIVSPRDDDMVRKWNAFIDSVKAAEPDPKYHVFLLTTLAGQIAVLSKLPDPAIEKIIRAGLDAGAEVGEMTVTFGTKHIMVPMPRTDREGIVPYINASDPRFR